jgi:hypothetical protein
MQHKQERPPILRKFLKRELPEPAAGRPQIVQHSLSICEDDSEGYNPYDKPPPPPTEAQLEAMARRGKLLSKP